MKLAAAHECSNYDKHLGIITLSVQSKLKESISLESSCGTWNRLLLCLNATQFPFILHVFSATLPTVVNSVPHSVRGKV